MRVLQTVGGRGGGQITWSGKAGSDYYQYKNITTLQVTYIAAAFEAHWSYNDNLIWCSFPPFILTVIKAAAAAGQDRTGGGDTRCYLHLASLISTLWCFFVWTPSFTQHLAWYRQDKASLMLCHYFVWLLNITPDVCSSHLKQPLFIPRFIKKRFVSSLKTGSFLLLRGWIKHDSGFGEYACCEWDSQPFLKR